jgi:glycosyltransferase involved in cell wall biosynthesis
MVMKILHYTLGLPPYRTGGLTKYSVDLMKCQVSEGQQIFLLFPGRFTISKHTKIKHSSIVDEIQIFEIINPLPVSLLGGINKPEAFMRKVFPHDVYKSFLEKIQPDIIHIHTLMGIHKEFFLAAKELNIKVIYTSHDYFGICPKVNLIDYKGEICTDFGEGVKCVACNKNAYSFPLIYLMQSKSYRTLKESKFVKSLRQIKKEKIMKQNDVGIKKIEAVDKMQALKYKQLREYYLNIFNHIDYFHFNSSTTKDEYRKFINIAGEVLPITHNNIQDRRIQRDYKNNESLKITFLGPLDKYKGFPLLREALNILLEKGQTNWHLNIYGNTNVVLLNNREESQITFHGRYNYNDLDKIFNNTDILVIPSVCKETFGFIGLEALSYGVPTLVSEHVGFKDIIEDGVTGIVFKANSTELAIILEQLIHDREILGKINRNICRQEFPYKLDKHVQEIMYLYKKVIGVN